LGDSSFPENPELAIKKGFERAEEEYMQQSITKGTKANQEKSGSCALVALIVGNTISRQ
jgi:protein phosphatase 2C family protein 2/3